MSISLNQEQLLVKQELLDFIASSKKYHVLMGMAGTGKTTLITAALKELPNKIIVFSATTNKAVSVLKIMSPLKTNPGVSYSTIHKLLNIRRHINDEGQQRFIYIEGHDSSPIDNVDILIVDEASMVNRFMLDRLDFMTRGLKIKIIFVGDINQLPPINETKSSVFSKNFPISKLTKIERYKNDIVKYAGSIIGCGRIQYKDLNTEVTFTRDAKDWMALYCKDVANSIMLAYTNNSCNNHNRNARSVLFNTKDVYVVGEKIVFNSPYYDEGASRAETPNNIMKFHTSEMGIIKDIAKTVNGLAQLPINDILNLKIKMDKGVVVPATHELKPITKETCPICYDDVIDIMSQTRCGHLFCVSCIKLWLDKNKCCPMCRCELSGEYITLTSSKEASIILNELIAYTKHLQINTFTLHVAKTNDKFNLMGNVVIIDPCDKVKYTEIYDYINSRLTKLKTYLDGKHDAFNKTLMMRMWQFFYTNYIDLFADIGYGYCITVHKSQGSTYDNVYVDLKDIVTHNRNDTRECVYTAVTRASNILKILK
jgi:hypothetical protein